MARLHLFEFEDQWWFPNVLRSGITDYLDFASSSIDLYKAAMPLLVKGVKKSGSTNVIDMCSGGGGGILKIQQHLKKENSDIKIILTDKFPNLAAFRNTAKASGGSIGYISNPVDALSVPASLKGFRTQFVSFHHFKPSQAKQILENAAHSSSAIGIFEATERTMTNFLAMLFTPLVVMLAVPFIKPFKFSRLFFTYIIPAIPLFTMWDGMVSVLRTYSVREMEEMTRSIRVHNYKWEIGKIKSKGKPAVIYILGYPETGEAEKLAA